MAASRAQTAPCARGRPHLGARALRATGVVAFTMFAVTLLAGGRAHAQEAIVLGGGGGRGIAHAGVLQALDARGHSPTIVIGTSMGAIVGALYAAGYPADTIAAVLSREDWRAVFAPDAFTLGSDRLALRPLLSMGLADAELVFGGVVPDAGINRRLVELLFDAGARARGDFDRLPRRFRAIAADLEDGSVVPLASGDLARATRASMAVPGVFSPVRWQDRTLIDGGIVDNVPVEQARALGATYVIASDVLNPLLRPIPKSRVAIGIRALRLLIRNAGPHGPPPDVLIAPRIPEEVTEAMFAVEATPLIEVGRAAGLEMIPQATADVPPPRVPAALAVLADTVVIEGGAPELVPLLRHAFRPVAGEPYDASRVLRRVNALYATGMFRGIWPRIDQHDGSATLVVHADPVPSTILALAAGFDDRRGLRGLLALRYRTGVIGAAEVRIDARGHDDLRAGNASLVRPLARRPDIALTAGAHLREVDARRFTPERDGRTRRAGGWLGAEWSTPTGGRHITAQWLFEDVDDDSLANGFSHGPTLRWTESQAYTRVVGVPNGVTLSARFGPVGYTRLHAHGAIEHSIDRVRGAVVADLGITSDDAPADTRFALGDPGALPWLSTGALRGTHRAVVGVDLAHRVFLDGALRLRARVGVVGDELEALRVAGRWRGGAEVGGIWPSPFGALAIGFAAGNRGETRVTIDIGSAF